MGAPVSAMIGRKLKNRYEILEHLGDGSTSTVYKALDERLGREVAIKLLLPQVRDTTRKRFFQEATAAATLNHPNIMIIYDVDEEDDKHFLVVEYVEGVSLSYYIPSTPEVVVDLGKQIALALQYAHDQQIIHRDIKPANIKVTSQGQIKIMDLGLALPREAKRVTSPGMVIGTPAYLSPEQAQGLKLDYRTDIYSLGVVLYEMATGQLPFNADDISALLLQQVKQPPPPPRLVIPDLPVALENVILKCLEKSVARRFQSCNALAAALDSVFAHQGDPDAPTAASRPGWADTLQADQAQHPARRPRPSLRVILADDHALLRKMLASFLETRDDIVVVAEAADGDSALQQTLAILPDVLLLDLNMPGKGGLDILPELRASAPQVKVLILTGREEEAYIVRALRLGANGYILKSADEGDLVEALQRVSRGEMVLGRGVAEKVVHVVSDDSPRKPVPDDLERKILLHVAAGYPNDVIARTLDVPITTVIEALAAVMDKLNAADRNVAALAALKHGFILLDDVHHLANPDA